LSQTGKDADVVDFLNVGHSIVVESEPETIQWFAVKYNDVTPSTFAIFDTFTSEAGRTAHLNGQVPVALSENAARLLVPGPVDISQVDVLVSKVVAASNNKVGLRVLLEAQPGKEQDVKDFLIAALSLVHAEPETLVWYAIYFPGTSKFGIVDFFADEAGRNAHLSGQVAAALFENAPRLLSAPPDIVKFDVLATKITE